MIAAYLGVFFFAVVNFCQFVLASTQTVNAIGNKEYVWNHPLLVFYTLVFLSSITDVLYSIFAVGITQRYAPFLAYLPLTWKALIGLDQLWMMIEFIVHLRFSLVIARKFS